MAADNLLSNIGPSSPPLQTPLTDKDGHLSPIWFAWFNQVGRRTGVTLPNAAANSGLPQGLVSPVTIQDTHAHRSNYNAKSYLGAFYFESDRTVFYMSALVSNVATWIYSHGQMIAALASRPAAGTLSTADTGFLFLASDTKDLYEFDGAAWQYYGGAQAAQDFDPVTDGGASLGTNLLRFLNLFIKNKVNIGGGSAANYLLEVLGGGNVAQIHFSGTDADVGSYLMSFGGTTTYITTGVEFNGSAWIAKATSACVVGMGTSGVQVFVDSGLTIGASYSPTLRFAIDANGKLTTYNGSATLANGTMSIPAVTTNGSITFVNGVATAFTSPVGN